MCIKLQLFPITLYYSSSLSECLSWEIVFIIIRPTFHSQRDEKGCLPPLSLVLFQEVERYKKLLTKVHASLDNLQKAIKGFVVMSDALEEVFKSCLKNQVFIVKLKNLQ
jgi:hypothetical protein